MKTLPMASKLNSVQFAIDLNQSGRGSVTIAVENVTKALDTDTLKVMTHTVDDYIAKKEKGTVSTKSLYGLYISQG